MVIFHKYFILNKKYYKSNLEIQLSAITSLYISIKLNYFYCNIEVFSKAILKILEQNETNIDVQILDLEQKILAKIGFDLNIDLPYHYVELMINYLKVNLHNSANNFIQITTNFINDSFKQPICLYYDPLLIALSCVLLTTNLFNVNLPDVEGKHWYNINEDAVNYESLIEIANLMKNMYQIISIPSNKAILHSDINSVKKTIKIKRKQSNKHKN